jgi:Family of unknown function (DUF6178)
MKIKLPPEKQVGHLTLLRQPGALSAGQLNALSFEERLDIVRSADGKQKCQLICEAKDGVRIVKRLPSQDLFLLAKDVGLRDFSNILDMVTPSQFTNFLDFDCWDYDRLKQSAVLEWFEALFEGADADKAFDILKQMDQNLLTLIVKRFLTVLEEKEQDADENEELPETDLEETPEAFKTIEETLRLIQNRDPEFFQQLCFVAISEGESILEEEVFQFQQGRLLDQGFPEYWEARKIYTYLEPDNFIPGSYAKAAAGSPMDKVPPGFVARANDGEAFFGLLGNEGEEELMWKTVFLVNKVIVADRLNFGDPDQVKNALSEVKDYLNIARMFVTENLAGKLGEDLGPLSLEELFRLGFSLTIKLGNKAEKLKKTPIGPFLDGPFHEFLKCLSLRKPCFYLGMEDDRCGGSRPFKNLDDIRKAEQWLNRVEIQKRLFEDHFHFDLSLFTAQGSQSSAGSDPEDVVLSDIFLTALANQLLGREFSPRPVPREDIPELHQLVSSQGKLHPEIHRETAGWLESLEKGGGDFAEFCLEIWSEEFCPLKPEALEPSYIGGLLIKS